MGITFQDDTATFQFRVIELFDGCFKFLVAREFNDTLTLSQLVSIGKGDFSGSAHVVFEVLKKRCF